MCGRYTIIRLGDFVDVIPWIRMPDTPLPPRYNIAPTQAVPVVANLPDPQIDYYRWGLVPSWAKDESIGNRMINARAETLHEKPSFKRLLARRRCLVPADGFYEWRKDPDGSKTPMYITLRDKKPFAFAGLWDIWHAPDGSKVPSVTVITTSPNELMKSIHDRMPVILPLDRYHEWLDPQERSPDELRHLLAPYSPQAMQASPVSRHVNSPKNDGPECIESMTAN